MEVQEKKLPCFMPTHRRTHDECRAALCITCINRGGFRLTEELISIIREFLPDLDYDRNHHWLPTGICSACKTRLLSLRKPNPRRLPDPVQFEALVKRIKKKVDQVRTRSTHDQECQCHYCERGHYRYSLIFLMNFSNYILS